LALTRIRIASVLVLALFIGAGQAEAVSPQPVQAENGMVVTAQHLASEVGAEILKGGGNAVDAAVAVGYALAVVLPCCGNIGGGGFATLHLADGKNAFINFREKAPGAATETMYLDAAGEVVPDLSLRGYKAVGVPGSVLGLDTMLAGYGTMTRDKVMAPAIRLAEEGFVLTEGDADILAGATKAFAAEPNVAAIFLNDGKQWRAGERLVQKNLAATLRSIAKDGPDAFYKGPIADAVVAASAANGGILTKQDFADFTVAETAPVRCSYRGYDIISSPPPSSGGTTLCLILNILEGYPMKELGFHSAAGIQLSIEAMRHAYVDRNFALGDPDFVENPLDRLLSKDYAAAIRAKIAAGKAGNSKDVQPGVPPHEGTETTHYSIVDKDGNAVALTYTVNAFFGARVIAGNTGFFLNDEMDDFTTKPGVPNMFGLVQGKKNAIAPGKRPLSSMSPTIIAKDGRTFMVIGSPGGSRIITITLETAMNVIDYGLDPQEAVDAPHFHHQWLPDEVFVEPMALSPDTRKLLTDMGYTITEQSPWGAAEAIVVMPEAAERTASPAPAGPPNSAASAKMKPGMVYGANDDRRPAGAAVGH
jgi:gamma-glutamyltranspeptidase/glutathione hydrolase